MNITNELYLFQGEAGKPGKGGERGPAGPQVDTSIVNNHTLGNFNIIQCFSIIISADYVKLRTSLVRTGHYWKWEIKIHYFRVFNSPPLTLY